MYSLLLSGHSVGGRSFSDVGGYWNQAWQNFMYVINWMQNTDILVIGTVHFTFFSTLCGVVGFCIIVDLIHKIFWG